MLVLSRRVGERILLGTDIEITVLENDGHQVRLGIRAPRDLSVLRHELLEQVRTENRQAAGAAQTVLGQLIQHPPTTPAPAPGGRTQPH